MKSSQLLVLIISMFPVACTHSGKAEPANAAQIEEVSKSDELHLRQKDLPLLLQEKALLTSVNQPEVLEFSMEYLMGKFDPAKHPEFVKVEKQHADEEGYFLRKDTYENFKKMWAAAQADGINLTIISATRNFDRQKQIWEAKWTGQRKIENGTNATLKYPDPKTRALKILEYSSMPGTSRHHWGTDIDLNDLDNFTFEQGQGKRVYDWLVAHAHEYGFCQPYTIKGNERPNGYNEEKWHWSYIPVAKVLTDLAARRLRDDMINGFLGAETSTEISVVENYVLGINKSCL
jgi:LAS superfamily LD-carboxypeptidase LdcB